MLAALNRLVVRISGNGWWFLATAAVMFLCLRALLAIGAGFPPVAGGAEPFDLQNGLTATQVLEQLQGYTDEARRRYLLFTAIDFVFPFAAGLFLASIAAFCLRHSFPAVYAEIDRRGLFPLLMAGSFFDWIENVAAVAAILSYPDTPSVVPGALVVAKRLKLTLTVATQLLVVLLLLVTGARWLNGRLRARGGTNDAQR